MKMYEKKEQTLKRGFVFFARYRLDDASISLNALCLPANTFRSGMVTISYKARYDDPDTTAASYFLKAYSFCEGEPDGLRINSSFN